MAGKNHNPSIARKILRDIKEGSSPEDLLFEVNRLSDPYYASLGLIYIATSMSTKSSKSKKTFAKAFVNANRVDQSWRRIELLTEISKRLKKIDDGDLKNTQYKKIFDIILTEKKKDINNFLIKNVKNFPIDQLDLILEKTVNLSGYEFDASKAVIRAWIVTTDINPLISILSSLEGELRIKLLGYLHLQLHKVKTDISPSALELALDSSLSEEMLRYLIRISSTPFDLNLIEIKISKENPEESLPILIAIIAHSDRNKWHEDSQAYVSKAEKTLLALPESNYKKKLEKKLRIAVDRLNIPVVKQTMPPVPLEEISVQGKHTLGLYNTYGGNWNHPHFKAVFKASNLCSAFDLDLALIGFPEISTNELIKEIKKEMRLSNEGYISKLISNDRFRFFEKDIDELWAGSRVVTTANPDSSKLEMPSGRLCMVMGLGPKGLPKSYIEKSNYHFEITGKDIAFETGTAMGAIAGNLSLM
ncbi:MAG: DUF531 family protein [Euryarchaeota archaeon]|jgi:uncharacterized protein|nr:DUF531 family protein [Euryarchaeota archaeon]